MLSLIAFTVAIVEPKLAFVARIYYPPTDKRISDYRLYVSDLHGAHRKQMPVGKNVNGVVWIGKDALAWSDENGKLFVSKLSPFRPILMKAPDYIEVKNNKTLDGIPRGTALVNGQVITPTGLRPIGKIPAPSWPSIKEGATTLEYTMPAGMVFTVDMEKSTVAYADKAISFESVGSFFYPIRVDQGVLWAKTREYGGIHGRDDSIYKMNLADGAFKKVVGPLGFLDFSIDSPYYAGMDMSGEDLISYGPKKSVIGAHLYAGNWKTGKKWLVLGGTVHVRSVSVQP